MMAQLQRVDPDVQCLFPRRITPAVKDKVSRDLTTIKDVLLERLSQFSIRTIVLGGALGRGEGSVSLTDLDGRDAVVLMGDYDIIIYSDSVVQSDRCEDLRADLSRLIGEEVTLWHVDRTTLRRASSSITLYELAESHLVLWGDGRAFKSVLPCPHADMLPFAEGSQLLFNRASALLMDRLLLVDGSARVKRKILYDCNKAILAVGDAFLLLDNHYHFSYQEKERRVRSDSIPGLDDRLRALYVQEVEFRLRPNLAACSPTDTAQLWKHTVQILAHYHLAYERLFRSRPGLTWEEYPEAVFHLTLHRPGTWLQMVRTNTAIFGLHFQLLSFLYALVPLRERLVAALPLLLYVGAEGECSTREIKGARLLGVHGGARARDVATKLYRDCYEHYLS